VHAAAGSGKTTALVARIVALVREGVPLGDLAAITFTRKAAGEMNERLYRELRRARRELGGREQALVREALDALPRCFIGTIHSFCARILRNYPLAAGLPSRFQAGVDDRDERELRQEALSSYLQEAHRERPDELAALTEWASSRTTSARSSPGSAGSRTWSRTPTPRRSRRTSMPPSKKRRRFWKNGSRAALIRSRTGATAS
jgi:ATP-dependent exoDNAse (exonuclease V) beta subunit